MNDDEPLERLAALRREHRELDQRIEAISAEPLGNQLEIARLKRRKLRLRDEIQLLADRCVPDIIA
jgi:hypothetical protein